MIRILLDRAFDNERHYIKAVGLSTDAKPTTGIITGSKFVAVDTGAGYLFDETAGEWNENQQLTEAVAAYLDDHPEALDQAAIEAMFGDQLDGIESDLSGLKSAIEELEAGSLSALGATAGQVPVADGLGSWAWGAQAGGMQTIQVSGTTPAITAVANTQYICGEVATLDITLPASGCIDVVFQSGSTATVLTVTPPTGVTVKWANGFDPTALEANTTYEIKIKDGLGVATVWGQSANGKKLFASITITENTERVAFDNIQADNVIVHTIGLKTAKTAEMGAYIKITGTHKSGENNWILWSGNVFSQITNQAGYLAIEELANGVKWIHGDRAPALYGMISSQRNGISDLMDYDFGMITKIEITPSESNYPFTGGIVNLYVW